MGPLVCEFGLVTDAMLQVFPDLLCECVKVSVRARSPRGPPSPRVSLCLEGDKEQTDVTAQGHCCPATWTPAQSGSQFWISGSRARQDTASVAEKEKRAACGTHCPERGHPFCLVKALLT